MDSWRYAPNWRKSSAVCVSMRETCASHTSTLSGAAKNYLFLPTLRHEYQIQIQRP
jgi:hypothetical protein